MYTFYHRCEPHKAKFVADSRVTDPRQYFSTTMVYKWVHRTDDDCVIDDQFTSDDDTMFETPVKHRMYQF